MDALKNYSDSSESDDKDTETSTSTYSTVKVSISHIDLVILSWQTFELVLLYFFNSGLHVE